MGVVAGLVDARRVGRHRRRSRSPRRRPRSRGRPARLQRPDRRVRDRLCAWADRLGTPVFVRSRVRVGRTRGGGRSDRALGHGRGAFLRPGAPRPPDPLRGLLLPAEVGLASDDRDRLVSASPLLYDERAVHGGFLPRLLVAAVAYLVLTLAIVTLKARMVRAEERQREMAVSDPLTGLGNRRAAQIALNAETTRVGRPHLGRRAGDESAGYAVVLLDLDDFKVVNDRHGHPAGDDVLSALASRLRAAARPTTPWRASAATSSSDRAMRRSERGSPHCGRAARRRVAGVRSRGGAATRDRGVGAVPGRRRGCAGRRPGGRPASVRRQAGRRARHAAGLTAPSAARALSGLA